MNQQQPDMIDLNQPVTVTLPLGAWNTMLGLLGMASQSLQQGLQMQIGAQLRQAQQRGNGADAQPPNEMRAE